ncbi:SDR family NAD(P)-dependent oxidoreductase [Streptomyces sp. JJ36]|nr:SDR family NAD(P)-dependent oxidoreductase [Streptomyces sp. JJ36]
MACRLPGAPSLEAFWTLLREGRDAVTEVPADRWDAGALYHPDPARPGRANTRWGGFIDGVGLFDPQFFGISPREAGRMDPQQRIMLELAWSAFEDSGTDPATLRDSRTGVFTAALWSDYARLSGRRLEHIGQHTATGEDLSIIPARISYTLGLRGPSIGVTTACSGALVALHLACQSLRNGECETVLAGGVNLLLAPESTTAMAKFGAMSPRGRSRAFDAGADGYVRAEGGGAVVLKPLSRAHADGDRIYCVIRGSAVNNDGYSNGLTAPNPQAQEEMLREAYARSRVDPRDVAYVEAHGTGTALGDPIEAGALARVLGTGRPPGRPLLIGSVKTNLGHLESAAGIAGFVKTALALHHRLLPPSLHWEKPNPAIDFGAGLEVPTSARRWPERGPGGAPAPAGVSSFGFGGTNCHVVLEGRPHPAELLTLSAADPEALTVLARQSAEASRTADPATSTRDLTAAAARRSVAGASRAAAVVRSRTELLAALDGAAGRQQEPATGQPSRVVLVFSGQGSQWAGMGRDLLHTDPVFAEAVDACAASFAELGGPRVRELLRAAGPASLGSSAVLQPLVFTVQVGLTAVWRSWGLRPDAVIGHSLGEAAAAHAAGRLGLHDAARVVHHRSRLMARLDGTGAVALVALDAAQAERAAERHGAGRVHVAGENSTRGTVLAGDPAALDACLAALQRDGVACHRVAMPVASHTGHCDELLPELTDALSPLTPLPGHTPMVSTVTGAPVDGPLGPEYWRRNLREPVRFAAGVRSLLAQGPADFLEIGPHPVLHRALCENAEEHGADTRTRPVLSSMHRGEDARETLLRSAAHLFRRGVELPGLSAGRPGPERPTDGALRAPREDPGTAGPRGEESPLLLTLSAHTSQAARDQAGAVADLLESASGPDGPAALCAAADRLRGGYRHRVAVVFRDRSEGAALLRRAEAGADAPGLSWGTVPRLPEGLALVFSGQATQWPGMGTALMRREPVFRRAVERHHETLRGLTDWSLVDELRAEGERSRLHATRIAQPALCALQLALAELWTHWGVQPDAVTGHSAGEIAAACVAGAIEPEEALRIAVERGRIMDRTAGGGRMVSLALSEQETAELLAGVEDRVGIAAVNAPRATVIAGEDAAVERILADPALRAVRTHPLPVDYAFHSPRMEPLQAVLARALGQVERRESRIPLVSGVTGGRLDGALLDAGYWGRTVRRTVRFADAVETLAGLGCTGFLEIGPHPALTTAMAECLAERSAEEPLVVPSLRRGDDVVAPLRSRGALWASGRPRARSGAAPSGVRSASLPEYPWQRERHWTAEAPVEHVADGTGTAASAPDPREPEQVTAWADRHGLTDTERAFLPRLLHLLAADVPEHRTGHRSAPEPAAPRRYTTHWEARPPLPPPADGAASGHWLLIGDGGVAGALAGRLRSGGGTVTVLPQAHADFPAELDRALETAPGPLRAAVHLPAADLPAGGADRAVDAAQEVLGSALSLIRRLAVRPPHARPAIWFVTRGARPDAGPAGARPEAPGDDLARQTAGAALWGFAGTLAHEHPELWGGLIDLDDTCPSRAAGPLADELEAAAPSRDAVGGRPPAREDRLALRAGSRRAPRLTAAGAGADPSGVPPVLDPDAAYLVTGGLGGTGLLVAERLAERGARRLVLAGRTAPSGTARAVLRRLESAGVRVTVARGDVSRRAEVARILDGIRDDGVRLGGLVHAAGVLDDGILLRQGPDRLARVLAPKAAGALHLHELTAPMRPDFFVLFSSFTATLGAPGQSAYTAANGVLDMLAVRRRLAGLPAVSVGWGPWRGVGMTSGRAAAPQRWRERGLEPMDPDACLAALDRALTGRTGAHELVIAADWPAYSRAVPGSAAGAHLVPVCGEAPTPEPSEAGPAEHAAAGDDGAGELRAALRDASAAERLTRLAELVALRVAEALGVRDPQKIDRESGLFDLGLDSLGAVRLAERLARDLSEAGAAADLSTNAVFDHPTVARLAAHLAETAPGPEETGDAELGRLLDEIEGLSEEEAALRLAELSGEGRSTGEEER